MKQTLEKCDNKTYKRLVQKLKALVFLMKTEMRSPLVELGKFNILGCITLMTSLHGPLETINNPT